MSIYPDVEGIKWADHMPHYCMEAGDYVDCLMVASNTLGIRSTALEYYLNIWVDTTDGGSLWPMLPDDLLNVIRIIRDSSAPHVILKMYRIQRGLE